MKKTKILLISILTLIIAITCSGCNFILDANSQTGGESHSVNYSITLKDSNELAQSSSVAVSNPDYQRMDTPYSFSEKEELASVIVRYCVTIETDAGSGSGIIIDVDDGIDYGDKEDNIFYVITCYHVISSSTVIQMHLCDPDGYYRETGYTFSGKVGGGKTVDESNAVRLIGADAVSDLALFQLYIENQTIADTVKKAPLSPLNGEKDYGIKRSENCMAVGFKNGVIDGATLTGEISTNVLTLSLVDTCGYMYLIEHTSLIAPGNSGGGLFNFYGELIGITNGGNMDNMSFLAIPLKTAKLINGEDRGVINIVAQLLSTYSKTNYGYVSGRWNFGINVSETVNGVKITNVVEDSNADKAGLQENDVITAITYKNLSGLTVTTNILKLDDFVQIVGIIRGLYTAGQTFSVSFDRTEYSYNFGRRTVITSSDTLEFGVVSASLIFCDTGIYDGISVSE